MASPRSDTAAKRAQRWGLTVEHALYRRTGDWYHQLKGFPGALLDEEGFVVFETESAYRTCSALRIRQDVWVPGTIRRIPGYVRVLTGLGADGRRQTYEKALMLEGRRVAVVQSRAERKPAARAACLLAHGYSCLVCGIEFGRRYGPLGEHFIHVHHRTPLAGGERPVDPIADLCPLCPNCHAMVHRTDPPLTVEELKALIEEYGA